MDIGGAERVVAHVARGLAARGYRLVIGFFERRSGTLARELADSPVEFLDLAIHRRLALLRLPRLVGWLRREGVDVVYTSLIDAHLVGRIGARLAGVPVVISTQQVMAWEGRLAERLNRWTSPLCTRIIAVSRNVLDYLRDTVGVPEARLVYIPNCVDLDAFPCLGPANLPPQPAVIGSIARLNPEKDQATLLRALVVIRQRFPGTRLIIAGDGPERERLEALTRTLALDGAVTFLGHVQEVRRVLETIDIFVQSSWVEGLPVAILEALASCRPVVASSVGGTPEALDDGRCGILVPPGEPSAMAEAIMGLLADPPRARLLAEAGRRHVLATFSASAVVNATDTLIRGLLSEQGPRPAAATPGPPVR